MLGVSVVAMLASLFHSISVKLYSLFYVGIRYSIRIEIYTLGRSLEGVILKFVLVRFNKQTLYQSIFTETRGKHSIFQCTQIMIVIRLKLLYAWFYHFIVLYVALELRKEGHWESSMKNSLVKINMIVILVPTVQTTIFVHFGRLFLHNKHIDIADNCIVVLG